MEMKWTPEQQKVIELRDRNILVSAAAGSGKTAVLVERILGKMTRKDRPIDIDQLLIVTFTRAAAGEMRERLTEAVENYLEQDPENEPAKTADVDPQRADHDDRRILLVCDPKLFSYHRSGSRIPHGK